MRTNNNTHIYDNHITTNVIINNITAIIKTKTNNSLLF